MRLGPGSRVFDRYHLEDEIGSGGTGVVWRANDELLGLIVALKQVSFGNLAREQARLTRDRTLREARLAARLRGHQHVVTIHNVLLDEDAVWLVLEYLPSRSLDDLLRTRGMLPPGEAARIGAKVADALASAHLQGIVHRDVKPGNVLLGEDGMVKLTDFGISRAASDPRLTETGSISGTLSYMAPEVARIGTATSSADVFSLGAMLYEAVEGEPPLGREPNPLRQLKRVSDGDVRPPSEGNPLAPVLARLLDPDPDARPDAAAARDLLDQFAQPGARTGYAAVTGDRARPAGTAPPGAPGSADRTGPVRAAGSSATHPHRRAALATAAVVLLLAVAGAVGLATGLGDSTAPGRAQAQDLTGVPPLPDAVPGVPLTGDPRAADPCALVDLPWLRQFGQPRVVTPGLMESCRVSISTPQDGDIVLDVYFEDPVSSVSELDGDVERIGQLSRVRYPPDPADDNPNCLHLLVLADNTSVEVDSYFNDSDDPDPDTLCAVTEVATANAVNALARDGVTYTPERTEDYTLASEDACAVLDQEALATVPGLDGNSRLPGFANWTCDYGARDDGSPQVYVVFRLDDARINENGTPATIAGRGAFVEIVEGVFNERRCQVWVTYRPAATPTSAAEKFSLSVDAAEPTEQLCTRASDLATEVVANLPPV